MDKIRTVKIKNSDGTISEETYTISVAAKDVDMANGKDLQDTIGTINVDRDGSIANQLKKYKNYDDDIADLQNAIDNLENVDTEIEEDIINLQINKIGQNDIIDNLESTAINKALSANQGKTLDDKIKTKTYYFNTVADMKAVNLNNGDFVITLGYYSINDGGGASYKIKTSSSNYCEILNNGLFAELIINEKINIDTFGAKGDDTTDDYDIFVSAIEYCRIKNKILTINKDKTYKINTELQINCSVEFYGTIDGSISFSFMQDRNQYINNVTGTVTLRGWKSKFIIQKSNAIVVYGINENYGFAWNKVEFGRTSSITLDSKDKGFINANVFTGGSGGHLLLTTTSGTGGEINGNTFINCDFSGGVNQNDTLYESNTLVSCYIEGVNTDINGNFNHIGGTYQNIPNSDIVNSSLMTSNAFAIGGKDFLSTSPSNLAVGGSWEKLNNIGVPICYGSNPGTRTIEEDETNPDGSGRVVRINWPASQSWLYFSISINKYMAYGGVLTLLVKGYELGRSMVFKNANNEEIYVKGSKTTLKNGWFLYRWAVPSMGMVKSATNYITTSGTLSEQKTTYFGGCFLSMYKTGFMPCVNKGPIRANLSTAPSAGIWDVGDIVTDSTGATIGWICTESPCTFVAIGSNLSI